MDPDISFISGQDAILAFSNNYPWNLWLLGYPDQAVQRSNEARTLAQKRSNPHVVSHNYCFAGMLYEALRDSQKVIELCDANIAMSQEHNLPWPLGWAMMQKGWALAQEGNLEEGLQLLEKGHRIWLTIGTTIFTPIWYAQMAEIFALLNQAEKGLSLLDEAASILNKTQHRMWKAEVFRIRGEILLRDANNDSEAELWYEKALEAAQTQKSKSFELRAAISLGKLWQQKGKRMKAHELVKSTYEWFTEGHNTPDLLDAKALIEDLS